MSKQLKIFVGIPAYGGLVSAEQIPMFLEFGATVSGSAERFLLLGTHFVDVNPISVARNRLVTYARKVDADWLLMIDADTWVRSSDDDNDAGSMLLRMISDADRLDASIVCAPVVRRRTDPAEKNEFMIYREGSSVALARDVRGDELFHIDSCATAVFALNIPKTRKLGNLFQFADSLSEDLYACKRVRQDGQNIFCDPRVRTAHKSRSVPLYSR